MKYRPLGSTGLQVSEVGLGGEYLERENAETVCAVVDEAMKQGINILDIFMSEPNVRTNLGAALKGRREKMILQGHIGSAWKGGQYCRTRDLDDGKRFFEDFLTRLDTDYVDIGMIHFVDTQSGYEELLRSGQLEYAQELKAQGIIKHIGLSSHEPSAARRAVEDGWVEVLMFSVNPVFDLAPEGTELTSLLGPRRPQGSGALQHGPGPGVPVPSVRGQGRGHHHHEDLRRRYPAAAESSPFGAALTPIQCIHYALTRPAVASTLIGCRSVEQVRQAVAYETAGEAAKDYASVLSSASLYAGAQGRCMYCNHCLPCPVHLDVAQVNKLLDLALAGDEVPPTVQAHYAALDHHAAECLACGACESRCPFHVPVSDRMGQSRRVVWTVSPSGPRP